MSTIRQQVSFPWTSTAQRAVVFACGDGRNDLKGSPSTTRPDLSEMMAGVGRWERPQGAGAETTEIIMTAAPTKKSTLLRLISHPKGVTIDALMKAIGWQPHSVRAALTGLRKDGHKIGRSTNKKRNSVYRIAREEK